MDVKVTSTGSTYLPYCGCCASQSPARVLQSSLPSCFTTCRAACCRGRRISSSYFSVSLLHENNLLESRASDPRCTRGFEKGASCDWADNQHFSLLFSYNILRQFGTYRIIPPAIGNRTASWSAGHSTRKLSGLWRMALAFAMPSFIAAMISASFLSASSSVVIRP